MQRSIEAAVVVTDDVDGSGQIVIVPREGEREGRGGGWGLYYHASARIVQELI